MFTKIVISLFLTLSLSANDMFYKDDIKANKAYEMQQKGAIIIDVRTVAEFKNLRAKNSINIPIFYEKNGKRVFNINFMHQVLLEIKNYNKEIVLICRSGSRTKFAANILAQEGFTKVYNIKYGLRV